MNEQTKKNITLALAIPIATGMFACFAYWTISTYSVLKESREIVRTTENRATAIAVVNAAETFWVLKGHAPASGPVVLKDGNKQTLWKPYFSRKPVCLTRDGKTTTPVFTADPNSQMGYVECADIKQEIFL